MDENSDKEKSLMAIINQLERERDHLRKDVEQLCVQQAGPSYLGVATRMHFQRTAALENEIEDLKKKLAMCTRENLNLQEELSEAYRIKGQLAVLHSAEVEKNMEAEKQLKFFQGCVAAAFAERDTSIVEAENAKEKEELMSQKHTEIQKRLEDLSADCLEHHRIIDTSQKNILKLEEQNEALKKVTDMFFGIKYPSLQDLKSTLDEKCEDLLHDSADVWSFNDTSSSNYISALEEELERLRNSVDNLQNKLQVGMEIENHLKKIIRDSEKKRIILHQMINKVIAELRLSHHQHRVDVMNILGEERSHMKSIIHLIQENIQQLDVRRVQNLEILTVEEPDEYECRVIQTSIDSGHDITIPMIIDHGLPDIASEQKDDSSDVLAQALQEKVAALLFLSQQEERHLLEQNVNAALQKKIGELQRNLLQVTNEKVKALMELANLKQAYQQLNDVRSENRDKLTGMEKTPANKEGDGTLRNLLKKTYLGHWVGTPNFVRNEANDVAFSSRRSNNMDYARIKIEYATLKERVESIEHLTNSIHRLRLSLVKVKESVPSEDVQEALVDIITEARLVETALGSSLPISWSADDTSVSENKGDELNDDHGDSSIGKMDSVSAAGFEMVKLVILAAQILDESIANSKRS